MKDSALIQFKLMLPAALKARIERYAEAHRRSLSQEIVATLEERYPGDDWAVFERLLSLAHAAASVADLSQEDRTFARSLRENIKAMGPNPSLDRLYWALQRAEVEERHHREEEEAYLAEDKP